MRITKQFETDVINANIILIESLRRTKDMRTTNQCETARTGNRTVMRIIVKNEDMRCMYMDVPNLSTSFRLNSEWIIPMILEIEKSICLFLNRITILVKDFKYNGAVVWNNLPYEVKVAESFCSFNLKELFIRQTLKIGSSRCLYSK